MLNTHNISCYISTISTILSQIWEASCFLRLLSSVQNPHLQPIRSSLVDTTPVDVIGPRHSISTRLAPCRTNISPRSYLKFGRPRVFYDSCLPCKIHVCSQSAAVHSSRCHRPAPLRIYSPPLLTAPSILAIVSAQLINSITSPISLCPARNCTGAKWCARRLQLSHFHTDDEPASNI